MAITKPKRSWRIRGFDGLTQIYRRDLDAHHIGENQVQALLMALAAKAGLDFDEIVGAYASRRADIANDLLTVGRDGPGPRFSCGNNPYFTAVLTGAKPR